MPIFPRAIRAIPLCLLATVMAQPVKAEEQTRSFDAYKCKFTLPGPNWKWTEDATPGRVFMAENDKGWFVVLGCSQQPKGQELSQRFVTGVEEIAFSPPQFIKTGGRFITYRGVKAYQAEGLRDDKWTGAVRIFFANGFLYQIVVMGENQIEKSPEFEAVMNSFNFIETPTPVIRPNAPLSTEEKPNSVAYKAGQVAGACLMIALFLFVVKRLFRRRT